MKIVLLHTVSVGWIYSRAFNASKKAWWLIRIRSDFYLHNRIWDYYRVTELDGCNTVNPNLPETNMSHFASYFLIYIWCSFRKSYCIKYPRNGEGFPLTYFMLHSYYLHYGFKISMLLKHNVLLIITLSALLLNIFVCVFKPHDFILCFLAKRIFVVIENL